MVGEADPDMPRLAVAHGVVDRLLRDAVELDRGLGAGLRQFRVVAQTARDAEKTLGGGGELADRGEKSVLLELDGVEAARKRARLRERLIGEVRDLRRGCAFG